jgi:phage shock protein PspC (stress-responsive transcriptional regulator)
MERRPRRERKSREMTDNRRLTRSRNKMIAGVCAGIAEYFGWEVTLFRVVFVLVSILSVAFPGILVYIVLWIVMPQPEA